MKLKLFLLIFSLALSSCSKNDKEAKIVPLDLAVREYPQKWQLFKMTGGLQGSETSGENMAYQEYYLFNEDNTFSKTRIENGVQTTVKGAYSIENYNNEQGFLLKFAQENSLIGSCRGEPEEYLYLYSDKKTLLSNWWACDGPGLFYKQVQIK